jgi:5-methylcytosine-specific restriction enzyme A
MGSWPYGTATWKRLRTAHLSLSPWCIGCEAMGRTFIAANTVDHVVPISRGGHPFPSHEGLASYCIACHSAKTARGAEAGAVRTSKPRSACAPDGTPLDPRHPWHDTRRIGADDTQGIGANGERENLSQLSTGHRRPRSEFS